MTAYLIAVAVVAFLSVPITVHMVRAHLAYQAREAAAERNFWAALAQREAEDVRRAFESGEWVEFAAPWRACAYYMPVVYSEDEVTAARIELAGTFAVRAGQTGEEA